MGKELNIIVLSPPGLIDPWIAKGAARAGFAGGVCLQHAASDDARTALEILAGSPHRFTISVDADRSDILEQLRPYKNTVARIVLHGAASKAQVDPLRGIASQIFAEVTTLEDALTAEAAGVDAIIVKGNEAGGRVGEETSFILLQRVVTRVTTPVWVHGGVGLHSVAACLAGGAAGVILDWQVALCDESNLPKDVKTRVARTDGSETAVLGQDCPVRFRVYAPHGNAAFNTLREYETTHGIGATSTAEELARWKQEVNGHAAGTHESGPGHSAAAGGHRLLLMGQDAAFAAQLAERYHTIGNVCRAIRREAARQCRIAAREHALGDGGPLARSHGTRYPIVQGPMTRVSDTAAFANAVAEGGALPFLALALLRGPQVAALLEETKAKLGDRPWGIGILGFVPRELREEQLAEVRKHPPPYAIIAGGRPDQAAQLETEGIKTYLHVPSPGLLRIFLGDGAKRVIFEGRECGGHVGPRSSLVLWDSMVRVILEHLESARTPAAQYHVLFAGGVHDRASSSMVAALAAPLIERGVNVGVLMGTAYLFTREAVECGAIVPGFQEEALRCRHTVLLETGVGHATRCADTPFAAQFREEKLKLQRSGKRGEEVRDALEALNLGRLRIASKAIQRSQESAADASRRYVRVEDDEQHRSGMYMIGQVAALRERVETIASLHEDVGAISPQLRAFEVASVLPAKRQDEPCDVAIVGMSCVLPKAGDIKRYWENILSGVNAITEVPPEHWDASLYYDADRQARDKVYSRWGGFFDAVPFDPMRYGMPPASVPSVEPMQLLALESVRNALADAGYTHRPFNRERTCVMFGAGGGVGNVGLGYGFRSMLPHYLGQLEGEGPGAGELIEKLSGLLPEWTEDSFAGLLLNVIAGRVANRFDFGGTNITVDAACASSLAAVRLAVNELISGAADVAVAGGADTMQSPFAYLCFSKTQALSPTGQARTFDESGDGIVIAEGLATVILKRLDDARRDGDRVYAVIRGIGSSSDGKDKGLTAPRPEGQMRALHRAYAQAGFGADTVALFEAHGTGTVVGDRSELECITRVLRESGAPLQSCAVGSVKSMIGHTKCTAGVAGLIKGALAVYHGVLPPTLGVTRPNPKARLEESPLYVNTETRPWIRRADGTPRRAGVSAFGFGGTNFHAVLEEPADDDIFVEEPGRRSWPVELFVFRGETPEQLIAAIELVGKGVGTGSEPALPELASAVCREFARAEGSRCLSFAAADLTELRERLALGAEVVRKDPPEHRDPRGLYYCSRAGRPLGKVAFLFPGQGSQRVNMLRELAVAFPFVREILEQADRSLAGALDQPLSRYLYPPPVFTDQHREQLERAITATRVAQPALGAVEMALVELLSRMGIEAEMAGGHSYGEYAALAAAGSLSLDELMQVSEARGRLIAEAGTRCPGTMAAVEADESGARRLISGIAETWIANLNSPRQTVIAGTPAGIEELLKKAESAGVRARPIRVSCGFHSPLIAAAREPFAGALAGTSLRPGRFPVFANTTAAPHAEDPEAVRALLAEHMLQPVRFVELIRRMHEAGARVFVEVGPGRAMSGLVEETLAGVEHRAVVLDQRGRDGLHQLALALAELAVAGLRFDPTVLFAGRAERRLDLHKLGEQNKTAPLSPTTWMISGDRAVPLKDLGKPSVRSSKRRTASETGQAPAGAPARPEVAARQVGASSSPAAKQVQSHPAPSVAPPSENGRHAQTEKKEAKPATEEKKMSSQQSAGPPVPYRPGVDGVMGAHHEFMMRFLETHQNVMIAYLTGNGGAASQSRPAPQAALPQFRAERFASPPRPASEPAFAEDHVHHRQAEPAPAAPSHTTSAEIRPNGGVAKQSSPPTRLEVIPAAPTAAAPQQAVPKPVAAQPSPAPVAAAKPLNGFSREHLVERLTSIVADRTGYPPDMLDLDLDLEADLGIDSIKRIEILGTLQKDSTLAESSDGADMEALARLGTLRAIVDWLEERAAGNGSAPLSAVASSVETPRPFEFAADTSADQTCPPPRMRAELIERPLPPGQGKPVVDGTLLLIGSGGGVSSSLIEKCGAWGVNTHLLGPGDGGTVHQLADESRAAEVLSRVRSSFGRIGGVVYLLPLEDGSPAADDPCGWQELIDRHLHALFNAAKVLESDLRAAADSLLIVATRMGGTLGSCTASASSLGPLHGGLGGIVKSLGREWDDVNCRVVDFDGEAAAGEISHCLLAELAAKTKDLEVAYRAGMRFTMGVVPAELGSEVQELGLTAESVVLATGGARGITAECLIELARRYPCRYVLAGRSPLPQGEESPETKNVVEVKALKTALRGQVEQSGQRATPALVEAAYRRLLAEREIRANLAALQKAGAVVEYHAVDVADAEQFRGVIEGLYARLGRIDGVVHGAGVIEDKRIGDKTRASFDRVVRTKVVPALTLAGALRPEQLKFLAFFSSVSARYGNRGQSDYAGANEVLNKLAVWLSARWDTRVVSYNWGPWESTGGMVSAELAEQFAKAGVHVINRPAGRRAFVEELLRGSRGDVEVIFGGPLSTVAPASKSETAIVEHAPAADTPLLAAKIAQVEFGEGSLRLRRHVDPALDRYLLDHQLDGKPVMPMAMALELFAEAVATAHPHGSVIAVHDLRVLRGLTVDRPLTIHLEASAGDLDRATGNHRIAARMWAEGDRSARYTGVVEVGRSPAAPRLPVAPLHDSEPLALSREQAYEDWLFHGPLFAGIESVEAVGRDGINATLRASNPKLLLAESGSGSWQIDPVIIDSGLQMIILWARTRLDMTPLPSRLGLYERFHGPFTGKVRCEARIQVSPGNPNILVEINFLNEERELLGRITNLEATCSRQLNRLASAKGTLATS